MLPLSRKYLYIGVFDQIGWIGKKPGKKPNMVINADRSTTTGEHLRQMLVNFQASKFGLLVTLSNKYAKCVVVPWNGSLKGATEKRAYAEVFFEQAGVGLTAEYVMHVEFKRYGAMGFAYAISEKLLEELRSISAENNSSLVNVMPIDALAYISRFSIVSGYGIRFLIEDAILSALVFGSSGLLQYEVETGVGGKLVALKRLIARVQQASEEITSVEIWSSNDEHTEMSALIKTSFVNASLRTLEPWFWGKYQ